MVKLAALSILSFGLFFNVGINLELGKFGMPVFGSLKFGTQAFAQRTANPDSGGSAIAHDCKHTGYFRDKCGYGNYIISNCRKKTTVMEASDCGYTP